MGTRKKTGLVVVVAVGVLVFAPEIYAYAMVNPYKTMAGINIANDWLNPSLPPTTSFGKFKFMWDHRDLEPH